MDNWTYYGDTNLMTNALSLGETVMTGLSVVATLSNGDTYALMDRSMMTRLSSDEQKLEIMQLTSTGLRDTGITTPHTPPTG